MVAGGTDYSIPVLGSVSASPLRGLFLSLSILPRSQLLSRHATLLTVA